jgi:hypothetical protein
MGALPAVRSWMTAVIGERTCPQTASRLRRTLKPPSLPWSTVTASEQELRADLIGLGTRHEVPEGAGQPIDRVEGKADRERVLDLLARDAGSQYGAHVGRIHGVRSCRSVACGTASRMQSAPRSAMQRSSADHTTR